LPSLVGGLRRDIFDLWRLDQAERKLLCKLPGKPNFTVLGENGSGDYLIELRSRRPREDGEPRDGTRGVAGKTKRVRFVARLIGYKVNGIEHRLVTNVFDDAITVEEFARVSHCGGKFSFQLVDACFQSGIFRTHGLDQRQPFVIGGFVCTVVHATFIGQ
jgi:hypothetical protein